MPAGRPTDFRPQYPAIAKGMYEQGATDAEVADTLRVSITTLKTWKTTRPEFLTTLKAGKETSDNRVQRSLYERAVGYTYDSVKIFCNTKTGEVTEVPYKEHVPPDTTACIFWLKNRRPAEWRDTYAVGGALGLLLSGALSERLTERLAPVLGDGKTIEGE